MVEDRGGKEAAAFEVEVSQCPFLMLCFLHPVFEPQYLEMFADLRRDTPPSSAATFVHVLSARSAPPAALEDAISGLTRVGVMCAVIIAMTLSLVPSHSIHLFLIPSYLSLFPSLPCLFSFHSSTFLSTSELPQPLSHYPCT